jgi:D-alanine-D-alanine ligase
VIESKKYVNAKVEALVLKAFGALGMKGYSKFDLRVKNGVPYFIDVNPNPAFAPPECDAPIAKTMQDLYGISFETLLTMILSSALNKR